MMHMITYISQVNIDPGLRGQKINYIMKTARQRNKSLGITGVLFLRGNTFFQTIEGPADAIRSVFQSIQADDRHNSVYVLFDESIKERRFADWSMECFHEKSCERDYLGIMHEIGEHFCSETGFNCTGIYTYCWRIIAALAPNRILTAA